MYMHDIGRICTKRRERERYTRMWVNEKEEGVHVGE